MIVKEAPTSGHSSMARGAPDAGQRGDAGGRRINVLFVTDHLGHAGGVIHGASRYYLQVLPRLDRTRFNVRLCILGPHHPFASTLAEQGVEPIFLDRGKWDVRALMDLARVVKQNDVDILHCLAMKGCLLGRLVGRAFGVPALIHMHDTNDTGRIIGHLQRRLAPWTYKALAVSEAVHTYTAEQMGISAERIETLYNGLDVEVFATPEQGARERVRRELKIADDSRVILVAGRVVESKGQRLLLGLMPRILEACPQAHLLIVGDGPDLPACKGLAGDLGISNAVTMPGQRTDMPAIVAAADVAVMPSLQPEGFGFAALEAAAGGKPVVAFGAGALREIIDDRMGILVPPGDEAALADAIADLALDSTRCAAMGKAGTVHARRFGLAQHLKRLEEIYAEMSQPRSHIVLPVTRGAPP